MQFSGDVESFLGQIVECEAAPPESRMKALKMD